MNWRLVGVANDLPNAFTFIVLDANRQATSPLRLRILDLQLEITTAGESLLGGWIRSNSANLLDELDRGIAANLKGPRLAQREFRSGRFPIRAKVPAADSSRSG